jgi:hypothetical protein
MSTTGLTIEKPFVLYTRETDGSGLAFIYIGSDKAKALDELLNFDGYFDSSTIHIEFQCEYQDNK